MPPNEHPEPTEGLDRVLDEILNLGDEIRYAALYQRGVLRKASRGDTENASSDETDTYEELLVNPTLLKLATQRGEIDCGGLEYLLVRYGHFFQLVLPLPEGHLSVCIEAGADVPSVVQKVRQFSIDHLAEL